MQSAPNLRKMFSSVSMEVLRFTQIAQYLENSFFAYKLWTKAKNIY